MKEGERNEKVAIDVFNCNYRNHRSSWMQQG